jgi:hypothetical protein
MKRILFITQLLLLTIVMVAQTETDFSKLLKSLDGISDVQMLESPVFKEKYVMKIRQNVDGDNADKGTFGQRIFVCLRDINAPTVIVTEGYSASYGTFSRYDIELGRLFGANIVLCEYRYFDQSVPEPCNWDYLTVANSLRDLHHVRQTLGQIFKGKWISTGSSKGGQTTMFYRAYYPDDVDASVSYVAPLNRSVEDGRHEKFLAKKAGTAEDRAIVLRAQQEMLKRRDTMIPLFKKFCDEHHYQFYLPIDEIYDYMVLEYAFAHFQYGTKASEIPSVTGPDEPLFKHFVKVSGPDYFAYPSRYLPFDVQAARELGYYGYSLKGLKKWTKVKSTKGYLKKIMLSPELRHYEFDPTLYKRTVKFLKKEDPTMIFIYGEADPWSASGVCTWLNCKKKENMRVYVQPGGDHGASITDMPEPDKTDIMERLTKWLQ